MKLSVRRRPAPVLPGLTATARVERRPRTLLSRLRPGDVAVVDHSDLDRATAQSLVDAGVVAVVNAAPMMSGRYPAQGPGLLAQHGVLLLDRVGAAAGGVEDGSSVRLHESALHLDDGRVLEGRLLALADLEEETERARLGLASQLETLTHNAAELLRREEELLLHGRGLPALATRFEGRAAVVAVEGPELAGELALVTPYVREQHPVVIAVHQAADRLAAAGLQPDVVVVDGRSDLDPPRAATLTAAADVVVVVAPGDGHATTAAVERVGVRAATLSTSATAEDAALLLAKAGEASPVVGVGLHADLEDFLDRDRGGVASTYLTRLALGPRLVDATAVPLLYSGRVRPRHLYVVMLAGLVALLCALAVTPAGQEWAAWWGERLAGWADWAGSLTDRLTDL